MQNTVSLRKPTSLPLRFLAARREARRMFSPALIGRLMISYPRADRTLPSLTFHSALPLQHYGTLPSPQPGRKASLPSTQQETRTVQPKTLPHAALPKSSASETPRLISADTLVLEAPTTAPRSISSLWEQTSSLHLGAATQRNGAQRVPPWLPLL